MYLDLSQRRPERPETCEFVALHVKKKTKMNVTPILKWSKSIRTEVRGHTSMATHSLWIATKSSARCVSVLMFEQDPVAEMQKQPSLMRGWHMIRIVCKQSHPRKTNGEQTLSAHSATGPWAFPTLTLRQFSLAAILRNVCSLVHF